MSTSSQMFEQMLKKAASSTEGGCCGSALIGGSSMGGALIGGVLGGLVNITNPSYVKKADRTGNESADQLTRYLQVGRDTPAYQQYYKEQVVPRIEARKATAPLARRFDSIAQNAKLSQINDERAQSGKKLLKRLPKVERCVLKCQERQLTNQIKSQARAAGVRGNADLNEAAFNPENRSYYASQSLQDMMGSGLKPRGPLSSEQKLARQRKQLEKLTRQFAGM